MYNFCYLFILFIVYSIVGYISEITYCSIESKKLILNRGFFIGPYLPIYGISCVLMNFFLEKYANDLVALFIMSIVICTIMEFSTSYILEKIFKVRWWDYSKRRFNLEGRVCLLNSILFGVGGVALVYIINPIIFPMLDLMTSKTIIIIALILITIFLTDLVISIVTLCKLKISSNRYSNYDATEEIKLMVSDTLKKNTFFVRRLLNAFPKMSGKDLKNILDIKKNLNDLKERIELSKEKLKEAKKEYKTKIKNHH